MKIRFQKFKFECKASPAEKDLQKQEAAFYSTLTANYKQQFAGQTAILNSLNAAFQPIIAAGPDQFGFSPQETASLRTSASDVNANNFQNAETALNENLASRGGGNIYTPSGATAQLEAGLLTSEAQQEAGSQNAITEAGYATGRQNFMSAAGILGNTAQIYNPVSYAGAGNTAESQAFNQANIIQQQNTAWEGQLGGILGGVAGAFLGGPMGGALGSNLFGGSSGGTNSPGAGGWSQQNTA